MEHIDFEELPTATCPTCKTLQQDMDGFGVIHCDHCGYCTHPELDEDEAGNWVCTICGDVIETNG